MHVLKLSCKYDQVKRATEKKYHYKSLQDITKAADDARHIFLRNFAGQLFLSNIAWAHISIWIL